jgi:hypothetical protein
MQELRLKHLNSWATDSAYRGGQSTAAFGQQSSTATPSTVSALTAASSSSPSQFAFELIVAKNRKRAQYGIVFNCEDEESHKLW